MTDKKNLFIAVLATFCLTATLFLIIPTRSQSSTRPYDPWVDLNDDGTLDIYDAIILSSNFGTSGTPLNKTQILLDLQSKLNTDIFKSGLLLHLPYGATEPDSMVDCTAILYSLDLDQNTPGDQQSAFVYTNTTITVTGQFQRFQGANGSGAVLQAFFIYSWTPSWPPPNSTYYYPLYNGGSGPYPGTGIQSFSFNLTVPNVEGVYYLYWCMGAAYSMEDAVNTYICPLWEPYAVIAVSW